MRDEFLDPNIRDDDADDHENTIRPAWILSPHRIWTARQLQKHSPLIAFAAVLPHTEQRRRQHQHGHDG